MPELPEVETYRKYFDRYALNRRIHSIALIDSFLLKDGRDPLWFKKILKNRVFTSSKRYGKYLLLEVSGSKYLILHFGMTG